MPPERKFAKDNIENLTTGDLLDAMYGSIQAIIERGAPDNVAFQYFLPPVPFGPELASFMDIGQRPQPLENEDEEGQVRFTVNDVMRSAVNFARMVDYVPTMGQNLLKTNGPDAGEADPVVDLNSLIASGRSISDVYGAVLENCKVVDNAPTKEEEEKLEAFRAVLYKEPKPAPDEADDDALLSSVEDDDGDIDLEALLSDGIDAGDFVEDPDKLSEPTKIMQLYLALQNRFEQVKLSELDKLATISPNDPNAGEKTELIQKRIQAAQRQWEVQGKKTQVEGVMARIEQLSRAGMPKYVDDLKTRLEANALRASLFASEEGGVSLLTENAHYTALRPNGILRAPSMMKITLDSSNTENWRSMKRTSTSGGGAGPIPFLPLFAAASGSKLATENERTFFSEGFKIEFEIVQGIVDRPWLDVAFLESPAYTTVHPVTKEPLDVVNEIVVLSDGEDPPSGLMPLLPMTVYFVRDLTVTSKMLSTVAQSEAEKFSGRAGVSFLGFGATGKHTNQTTSSNWSQAQSRGEVRMEGLFLIGFGSRFLKKAPNPAFESHPNESDWI